MKILFNQFTIILELPKTEIQQKSETDNDIFNYTNTYIIPVYANKFSHYINVADTNSYLLPNLYNIIIIGTIYNNLSTSNRRRHSFKTTERRYLFFLIKNIITNEITNEINIQRKSNVVLFESNIFNILKETYISRQVISSFIPLVDKRKD